MIADFAKPRPLAAAMRALGRAEPPLQFLLADKNYVRTRVVKHDFWAATAFYDCQDGSRAVAKINRLEPFFGIHLAWIGRWLCRREVRVYRALGDLPNVPELLGTIGSTGFVHAFVPGRPLARREWVSDEFFPELRSAIAEIHRRNIAHVDANKRENILLGDDGRPHLIDFQISFDLHELGDWFVPRGILRQLQAADQYHLSKHQRRLRPDQLTPEQARVANHLGVVTRVHRFLGRPYFAVRRPLMKRLRSAGVLLPEGSK